MLNNLVQESSKVIAAAVVPVIVISACGLLCLAFYNRLAAIVARLRTFQRERFQEQEFIAENSAKPDADPLLIQRHQQFLENLQTQTVHVTERAHLVRNTLMCLLTTIGCFVLLSLALGLSTVLPGSVLDAISVILFLIGMIAIVVGVAFAMKELRASLEPVELESRFVSDLPESTEEQSAQTV